MVHCPFCDAMLSSDAGSSRCPQCGSQLLWNEESTPAPPAKPAAEMPRVEDSHPSLDAIVRTIVNRAEFEQAQSPVAPIPAAPSAPLNAKTIDTPFVPKPLTHGNVDATIQTPAGPPAAPVEEIWRGTISRTASPRMTLKTGQTIPMSAAPGLAIRSRQLRHSDEYGADEADYELLERIGEGGVGVVFAARQASVDRTVAIKMLKSESKLDADSRQKFLSEAVVTGDLDHPNIVPIYDLGSDDRGALFYSMKRVRGTPWSECLQQKSVRENLEILLKVADAIAFAHSRAVVHRDIKPENVMLGDFGEVLVMDWGIALATSDAFKSGRITQSSSMGGTPAYMSPEMATGPLESIGTHSDVYLLGAVLFEMVTALTPHTGADVLQCLHAAARNEIQPTDKDGELLDIALRAMHTDVAQRHASVRDFQGAIRSYQSHSESIALVARSEDDLATAKQTGNYSDYARAVFACEEALALWPQNARATEGRLVAQLAYATAAFEKEDFDLGLSLLDQFQPRHQPLVRALTAGQRERRARQARLTQFRRVVLGLAALIFIVVSCGLIYIRGQNATLATTVKTLDENRNELVQKQDTLVAQQKELNKTNNDLAAERTNLENKTEALEKTNVALDGQRRKADESARAARREERSAEQTSYLSRISLAAAQGRENAFLNVRDSLRLYEQPQLAHWRHWEWGRLQHVSRMHQQESTAQGRVESLAVAPKQGLVISGAASGALEFWNPKTWQKQGVATLPLPARAVAVSPDGTWLAVAQGSDVLVWKLADWLAREQDAAAPMPAKTLTGHRGEVVSLAFGAKGDRLVSASLDQTARLWNFILEEKTVEFSGHSGAVWQAALSPDGAQVATASDDRTVGLWNAATGKRIDRFRGHKGPVYAVAYAPQAEASGYRVASGGADRQVLLWNTADIRPVDYDAIGLKLTNQESPLATPATPAATTPEYTLLGTHNGDVRAIGFAHDGKYVISGGHDNTVRVWDPAATNRTHRVLRGHGGWVRACAALDDGTLVSGGYDSLLKTWDYENYRERVDLAGHDDAVIYAAFSHNGAHAVTAGRDRKAIVWDVGSGKPLATLSEGHEFLTSSATYFGKNDDRLLTSAGDGSTIVWSLSTGAQQARFTGTGSSAVAALSPDKKWIATGSNDSDVLIWDADQTGAATEPLRLAGHAAAITSLAFTMLDGQPLLFSGDAGGQGRLWLWNAQAKAFAPRGEVAGHHSGFAISAAQFTASGARLVTAGADHQVKQWRAVSGEEIPDSVLEHDDAVRLLALTPDGNSAVTVTSLDEQTHLLQVWNLATRTKHTRKLEHAVQGLTISPDGKFAVLSDANPENTVWRWDLKTHEFTRFWPKGRLTASVWGLAFSPDGQQLLTVGGNHARLWNVASGERLQTFSPHGALVSANFSLNGKLVVTAGQDGSAKVWNVAEQRVIAKIAGAHPDEQRRPLPLRSASFVTLPNGQEHVLTTGDDNRARLWSLGQNGAELVRTFHDEKHSIETAATSPDGQWLLTAADDGTAQLWNIATGDKLRTLGDENGHALRINAVAFSSDGRLALTGGDDNLAIVWNAQTGELLRRLPGHTAGITAVGFSPDARRAVTASNDSTAKLWDIDTGREILTLDAHQSEVTAASMSADGRWVLTAGRDRVALLWPSSPVPPAIALAESRALYREQGEVLALDESPSLCDPSAAGFAGAVLTVSLASDELVGVKETLSLEFVAGEDALRVQGDQVLWTRAGLAAVPVAKLQRDAAGRKLEIVLLEAANHYIAQSILSRFNYAAEWQSTEPPPARNLEVRYRNAAGVAAAPVSKTIEFAAATETKVARKQP